VAPLFRRFVDPVEPSESCAATPPKKKQKA